MSATQQRTKNTITLKGSTDIITEFFEFSINSILYQRGIYPAEQFKTVKRYDTSLLLSTDDGLKKYLSNVLQQLSVWLMQCMVQKLVVVVCNVETKETLERWVFDIQPEKMPETGSKQKEKPLKEIQSEIKALIRQITSCVTFLPELSSPCTFDLLVYTDSSLSTPQLWEESDPKFISKSAEVKLRSFTTTVWSIAC